MAADAVAVVLVSTDSSPAAGTAVRRAAEIAAGHGAALHIIGAAARAGAPRVRRRRPAGRLDDRAEPDALAAARAALDEGEDLARPFGVRTRRHLLAGDPVEAICIVAQLVEADLIVVGDAAIAARLRRSRPPICDRVLHAG